jgi:hypothetical protein
MLLFISSVIIFGIFNESPIGFNPTRNPIFVHVSPLRKEQRLRVCENRVLRRIFGPKREEVVGGWRRLHNEELHNLCISLYIIRVIKSRRMGYVACIGEMRNAYKFLFGKPEGKT